MADDEIKPLPLPDEPVSRPGSRHKEKGTCNGKALNCRKSRNLGPEEERGVWESSG